MGVMRQMLGQIDQELRKSAGENPQSLHLERLLPSPYQPRRFFSDESLRSLAESIRQHGVLEPLLVRPTENGRYQIVAGERRWKAAQMAGLKAVPVIIRPMDERTARMLSLAENLQREDLNLFEQTLGVLDLLALTLELEQEEVPALLQRMRDEKRGKVPQNVLGSPQGKTVEEVFSGLGLTWESFVQTRLPLLKLPEDLQRALQEGRIPYTVALELRKVSDPALRQELMSRNLSLRELRIHIREARPSRTNGLSLDRMSQQVQRLKGERRIRAEALLKEAQQAFERLRLFLEDDPPSRSIR